jgi:spoIIIJ-associated protein
MINSEDIKRIKNIIEEFFSKMTVGITLEINSGVSSLDDILSKDSDNKQEKDIVEVIIKTDDPQILIGEKGQTLNEIQKILKFVISKALGKNIYLNLDINEYKKKKTEYLKGFARDLADEVALTKEKKVLSPMSSYERRVIHATLAERVDIKTESEGEGIERKVVIYPK